MDRVTFEGNLRKRLGDPPVEKLPSEQVTESVDAALREFSRYRPLKVEVSLDLEVGVSEYDAPDGAIDVEEFAFLPDAAVGLFAEHLGAPEEVDHWRRHDTRDEMYDQLDRDVFLKKEDLDPDIQIITGSPPKFRIHPAPKWAGSASLRVRKRRTFTDVLESDIEHIQRYAEGLCLLYMGRQMYKTVTKVPTATGQLYLNQGDKFREEGEEKLEQFKEDLGGGATTVARG